VDKSLYFYDYAEPATIGVWIIGDDEKRYFFGIGQSLDTFKDEADIRKFLYGMTGIKQIDSLGKESDIIGKRVRLKGKIEHDSLADCEIVESLEALT